MSKPSLCNFEHASGSRQESAGSNGALRVGGRKAQRTRLAMRRCRSVLMLVGRVAAVAGQSQILGRFPEICGALCAACIECIFGRRHGVFIKERAAFPHGRIGQSVGCRIARYTLRPPPPGYRSHANRRPWTNFSRYGATPSPQRQSDPRPFWRSAEPPVKWGIARGNRTGRFS